MGENNQKNIYWYILYIYNPDAPCMEYLPTFTP